MGTCALTSLRQARKLPLVLRLSSADQIIGCLVFMFTLGFGIRYFSLFLLNFVFASFGAIYSSNSNIIARLPANLTVALAFMNWIGNMASIWTLYTYGQRDAPQLRQNIFKRFGGVFRCFLGLAMKNYFEEEIKASTCAGIVFSPEQVDVAQMIIRNGERTPGWNRLAEPATEETKSLMERLFQGGSIPPVRSASAPPRQASAWAPPAPVPAPRATSVPSPSTMQAYDCTTIDQVYRELEERKLATEQKLMCAKFDLNRQRYRKVHANSYIQSKETVILESGLLTEATLHPIAISMAQGRWHFFRDPNVMEAVARGLKPVCNGCSKEGRILIRDSWRCR